MSCYICSKDIFTKVLKAWSLQGEALSPLATQDELNKAWSDIVSLNYEAYKIRYKDDDPEALEYALRCPVREGQLFTLHFTQLEMYEALKEYMYQVSEGDDYPHQPGYYKCRWCLDTMLEHFIRDKFGEE